MQTGLESSSKSVQRPGLGLEELGMAAEMIRGDARIEGESEKGYVKPSPRALDGIWVDGKAIEDIFKL